MGSTSTNRDNTSRPRQAGISEQLSIVKTRIHWYSISPLTRGPADRVKELLTLVWCSSGRSAWLRGLRGGRRDRCERPIFKISLIYKKGPSSTYVGGVARPGI